MPHYIIYYSSHAEVDAEDEESALCIDADNLIIENIQVLSINEDTSYED